MQTISFDQSISYDKSSSEGGGSHDPFASSHSALSQEVPYQEFPVYMPDEEEYEYLMNEKDINKLKYWIRKQFNKVNGYLFLKEQLVYIILRYLPYLRPDVRNNPSLLISHLNKILTDLERKFRLFDLSLDNLGTLEGSALAAKVDNHKKKMSVILEILEDRVKNLHDEATCHRFREIQLETELKAAEDHIKVLNARKLFEEEVPPETSFLNEMKLKLSEKEHLHSTLLDEIEKEKQLTGQLRNEVVTWQSELVKEHESRIEELSEVAKDVELEDGLKKLILQKIKSLNANTDECKKAVNDWMNAVHVAMEEKEEMIETMKNAVKSLDDDIATRQIILEDLSQKCDDLDDEAQSLRQMIMDKEEECRGMENEIYNLTEYIKELDQKFLALSNQADQKREEIQNRSFGTSSSSQSPRSPRSPNHMNSSNSSYFEESMESPERFLGQDSPNYFERFSDGSSPLSLDSSRSPGIPTVHVTPPSPIDLGTSQSFYPDMHIPNFRTETWPGTQTISQPRSRFSPENMTVDPSTQSISSIKNRFDVGQSFNMQTLHSGTRSPYHQVTRVDSSLPQAGPSHMLDSPLNVTHLAELTPPQFVTPFISKTRFGYTDPTAKVLNLPPGDDLDIGTTMRKQLLLTSSQREHPLLVNIDVEPQPLVQTETGEHFICDISLDVKPTGKSQQQQLSPVFTYGAPPAVTPTTTRRHGPFTPRGIFKKKHFNVRRLYGRNYESPEMAFSPHYLPFDRRSPASPIPPSPPFNYSDGTISWEKVPGLDSTFDASPPSPMNRTFDTGAPPAMNRTFGAPGPSVMNRTFDSSPSPVIKGPSYRRQLIGRNRTFDRSPSPVDDRAFDRSPSPMIKRPYGVSPGLDETFDSSSSGYNRTFDRSSSSGYNRTFDRSASPGFEGTSDRSSSPRRDRTFDRSPSPRIDRTFDRSPSPVIKRTFYRSPSTGTDRTSDRYSSPGYDRSIDRSMSPSINERFDMTSSPRFDSTFDSHKRWETFNSKSPDFNRTFDRSMSPRLNTTFNSSKSPRLDGTFDRNMSPRLDGTFDRSPSPGLNTSYDRSYSPKPDGTFSRSPSPELNTTFDRSNSPQMKRTFDKNVPPQANKTFGKYLLNTTYDKENLEANRPFDKSGHNVTIDESTGNPNTSSHDSPVSEQNRTPDSNASSNQSEKLDR